MSGPITAANASPEFIPNTATATAIASSKLLEAAVKDRVTVCSYVAFALIDIKKGNKKTLIKSIDKEELLYEEHPLEVPQYILP